jgi:hypothetical protein
MSVEVSPGQVQGVYQWEGRPTWLAFREVKIDNRTGTNLLISIYQDPDGIVSVVIEPGWAPDTKRGST